MKVRFEPDGPWLGIKTSSVLPTAADRASWYVGMVGVGVGVGEFAGTGPTNVEVGVGDTGFVVDPEAEAGALFESVEGEIVTGEFTGATGALMGCRRCRRSEMESVESPGWEIVEGEFTGAIGATIGCRRCRRCASRDSNR